MKNYFNFLALLILFSTAANAQQGLIAHYPLDANPNDTTGNYGPMTLSNTPFQNGGIYCDGIYQYSGNSDWCEAITPEINVSNFIVSNTLAFSIQAKFKVSAYGVNHVFDCWKPFNSYPYYFFDYNLWSDSSVGFYNYINSSWVHSTARYSINTWHTATVTFIYYASSWTIEYYIDTTLAGSYQGAEGRPDTIVVDITNDGWSNAVFNGILRDLKIYSTAITPTEVRSNKETGPESFDLSQNYPNPFNPTTLISYQVPSKALVVMKVYDMLGREIQTLVNEQQSAGSHSIIFSASNLPSGVYFYRLQTGTFAETKKLMVLK